MRTAEDIIEEYTHADWAKRLNLYFQYRDLRGTFYQMEVEERHLEKRKIVDCLPSDEETPADRLRTRWRRPLLQGRASRSSKEFLL